MEREKRGSEMYMDNAGGTEMRLEEAIKLLKSAYRWLPDNLATLDGGPTTKEKIADFLGLTTPPSNNENGKR